MTVSSTTYLKENKSVSGKIADMSVQCPTVTVLPSTDIFATDMVITPTICSEPCTITINVTYKNSGNITEGFVPAIIVDEIPTSLPITVIGPNDSIIKSFTITNLIAGPHTICAEPIGDICQVLNISPHMYLGDINKRFVTMMGLTGFLFIIGKEEECENYKNEKECINSNCEWREKEKMCKQKII